MWAAVRRLTGRVSTPARVDGVTAEVLNQHYADISTDPLYNKPPIKPSDNGTINMPQCISECELFRMLDTLKPTSAGLDGLPAWYLKVAAPVFCRQLAYLFNLSLATATVPHQWKEACITRAPKVPVPSQPADFRPISITPILTRVMERAVVHTYLYPAIQKNPLVSHSRISMPSDLQHLPLQL